MGGFMLLGILVAIGVVIIMLLWWCISTYNGLVTLRNRYQNSFSQIQDVCREIKDFSDAEAYASALTKVLFHEIRPCNCLFLELGVRL